MSIIVPAILTDDEKVYEESLKKAEHVSSLVQVDIVDGVFANSKTVGLDTVSKYPTTATLEIHLMVNYPQDYIDELVKIEYVGKIIVPYEVEGEINEYIYHVKNHARQVGLSINPQTPVDTVSHFFPDLDMLLVLGVNPGWQGQKFNAGVLEKVRQAKNFYPGLVVELDGGVRFENVKEIAESGVDLIAAGSVLFGASDFFVAYDKLVKNLNEKQ